MDLKIKLREKIVELITGIAAAIILVQVVATLLVIVLKLNNDTRIDRLRDYLIELAEENKGAQAQIDELRKEIRGYQAQIDEIRRGG